MTAYSFGLRPETPGRTCAGSGRGALTATLTAALAVAAPLTLAFAQQPPLQPAGIVGAPQGSGPSPAVAESVDSLRTHTLYRPAAAPSAPMPLVLWGNGACRDNGLQHSAFLREVASHGFFVIALGHARFERESAGAGDSREAPAAAEDGPPAAAEDGPRAAAEDEPRAAGENGPRGADETDVSQMAAAIDWAEAQRNDGDSPFRDWIDTSRVAVMGHSCGGLQAIRMAADARVATSMTFNSGVLNRGPDSGASGIDVGKDELARLNGPIAYISGGPEDIAHENAADDVARITHVPVFFAYNDVGHGGTFWSQPDGGDYAGIAVAWLRWRLEGDARAGETFGGVRCGLCARDGWTVPRRVED